jgi:hypothetical protein
MKFAKFTFLAAGIYGLLVLLPQYFVEFGLGADPAPVITEPGFYYGFIGVAVAFQLVFLIIATDPVKYRLMMLPSIVEKASFAIATAVLFSAGRIGSGLFVGGMIDGLLGVLFVVSYLKVRNQPDRGGQKTS